MAEHPVAETEEWRAIPGHPGYEASSLGRVRSVDRWIVTPGGRRWFHIGGILRPNPNARYHAVRLGYGKPMTTAHVVVCETFHGPRPSRNHEVAHWNGDSMDNRATNLRWATRSQNALDRNRHGTMAIGPANYLTKLTKADVIAIRKLRAKGMTLQAIGARFGIGQSHVKRVADREAWKHLP